MSLCAGNYPVSSEAQLNFVKVLVEGKEFVGLFDSGCSRTVLSGRVASLCGLVVSKRSEKVLMMNGTTCGSDGSCGATILYDDVSVNLNCLVAQVFSGCDILLGIDFIRSVGGVCFKSDGTLSVIKKAVCLSASCICDLIEDDDFTARFDGVKWTMSWKWKQAKEPLLANKFVQYPVKPALQEDFDGEIQQWIRDGWLTPYNGVVKGVLPLLAVEQKNKEKVRPVLDYRVLNTHISSHTAEADVCHEKLRSWRKLGSNAAIVDLRKAYLQIHVDRDLWPYQVVYFKGTKYCLTRLGFGLCVAPKVMTLILKNVLSREDDVRNGTDSYIDDIFVNLKAVSCEKVANVLRTNGLESKPSEKLTDCRVLGLRVRELDGIFMWSRDNALPNVNLVKTRRDLFSFCGRVVGHYPCAAWLCPMCSFVKRSCNGLGWDDKLSLFSVQCVEDINNFLNREDPVKGQWTVPAGDTCKLWCDASSLAIGVVLFVDDVKVEDQCWLRPVDDGCHINVAELEAVVKGLSLAMSWKMRKIHVMTDSSSVYSWIESSIGKDQKIKVRGLSEVLVRRRLQLVVNIVQECNISLTISLVPSCENKADELTRVPSKWLRKNICSPAVSPQIDVQHENSRIHELHHFGVDWTFYFVKRACSGVEVRRKDVERVVKNCNRCRSIDPSAIRWSTGELSVESVWYRVAYLSIIDCGPSRFTIWRQLNGESAVEVCEHIKNICVEHGPPYTILVDNGSVFKSAQFQAVLLKWNIQVHYRAAYRPSGNGIVERIHRTIKRIATRSSCSIAMATYWYNVSPKNRDDENTIPSHQLFSYKWRCIGIDDVVSDQTERQGHGFGIGTRVFVKPANPRCTTVWREGVVTGQRGLIVEVDGVPRHAADIRAVAPEERLETPRHQVSLVIAESEVSDAEVDSTLPGRPQRVCRRPGYLNDFVEEEI